MAKVLVVDDELSIRRLLRNTLERAGYEVVEAASGREALAQIGRGQPDAVLLDLGLPDRDGLELVPLISQMPDISLIVVSARDDTDQKVAALDLGAHDYVTKPFDAAELAARLRGALRRTGSSDTKVVTAGPVTINLARRLVTRDGHEIHLTRKEYEVLALLAEHTGRVVTHKQILQKIWGGHDPRVEYLRMVVRNLRQKLEAPGAIGSLIGNELGIGYRLIE